MVPRLVCAVEDRVPGRVHHFARRSSTTAMATGKTVLLVEDNPSVLFLMQRAIAADGYTILTASDGETALRMLKEGRQIDVLVADLVLPRIGGLELAWRMSEQDPDIQIILISGYAGEEAAISSLAIERAVFLEKPFSAVTFRSKVRELIGEEGGA